MKKTYIATSLSLVMTESKCREFKRTVALPNELSIVIRMAEKLYQILGLYSNILIKKDKKYLFVKQGLVFSYLLHRKSSKIF